MQLTDHDLRQINKDTLARLSLDQLLSLSERMMSDLKEARDRLNQNSNNSSRPSGSMPPWSSNEIQDPLDPSLLDTEDEDDDDMNDVIKPIKADENDDDYSGDTSLGEEAVTQDMTDVQPLEESVPPVTIPEPIKRSAGKQEGAPGFGRTQQLDITEIVNHARTHCTSCGLDLGGYDKQVAWTAFYTIDIAEHIPGISGILLTNVKHIFFQVECECGHINKEEPHVVTPDPLWPKTHLAEWRLVGPRLAAMIVLLSKRHRNSARLIREFLLVFLRLELSVGTINKTIREAGRSVAPLEEELIREIEEAALVYADETSWKEAGMLRWLWVFRTLTVVFFTVGKRDRTIFCNLLLNGRFKGIVMSDGWVVYREYANRLRCWAHLIRKARGLSESYHTTAARVGLEMLTLFTLFQNAIYEDRNQSEPSPLGTLVKKYEKEIAQLKALCLANYDSDNDKLRAFSRELLNDWDIIMKPINDPSMPLTNNDAERILRHWVIDRRLSHGTRTEEGTRSFTLLASVIETCRLRGAPTWDYLTSVITAARKGLQLPTLPIMQIKPSG